MIITCPKCFSADDVLPPRRLPDGLLQYRCINRQAHDESEWLTTSKALQPPSEVREGVTDDLLEPLEHCVSPDDPFLEYGIVEHRLRTRFPDLFAAHVAEQGHSMFGSRAYTASSVRFGVALSRLERTGTLVSQYGPTTGAWRYNGQVTYWTRAVPSIQRRKTWAEYCAEIGRSPEWTDDDRHGLTIPE
ncbi:hypothetical protein [Umezawaea beigongshangensis]|uniref:hypothetical protein n=1 Tax=Umezawaea beigongshangensis TaxID=2780383 RepID=UPI0018F24EA3|nr:hypothetical protein [Umezawaea beigongshangensis]